MIGKIVFSGVAGSGKSSVIDRLSESGYKVVEESARKLIKYYQEFDESKLPWNDMDFFQKEVTGDQLNNYVKNYDCFFDRGLVDDVAYKLYMGKDVPNYLSDACKFYKYDTVFLFPFWEEIYKQDSERVETPKEAEKLFDYLIKAYKLFGYNPIVVPKVSIEERVEFVLNKIK